MTQEKPKFDDMDAAFNEVANSITAEDKKSKDKGVEDVSDASIDKEIKELAVSDKERDQKSIDELGHVLNRIYGVLGQGKYLLGNLKEPSGENTISGEMRLKDVFGVLEERQKEIAEEINHLQERLKVEEAQEGLKVKVEEEQE
ncbi:MAG: hypothetical protein Q8Q06_03145 [bacterium]|nr:hypothetical protein [bacterium]